MKHALADFGIDAEAARRGFAAYSNNIGVATA
jgi:hypothetical protein